MAKSPGPDQARLDRIVAEARRQSSEREATYRERALKLYPHVSNARSNCIRMSAADAVANFPACACAS
jgi:hypothetical protein